MLEYALGYLKLGWHIVPLKPTQKYPRVKWKPFQATQPTIQQITNWFTKWPDSNIGVITGPESGICSLDIDSPEANEAIQYKFDIPDTIIQETGRGRQYIFKYPEDDIKSQAGLMEHVDFKGKNGIIVLPPSTHSSGKQYKWLKIDPVEDGLDDLLDLPDDVKAWIYNGGAPQISQDQRSHEKPGTGSPQSQSMGEKDPDWINKILFHGVKKGRRDEMSFKLACAFVEQDREKGQILETMLLWNRGNHPPLDDSIIRDKCKSAEQFRGKHQFGDLVQKKMSNFTRVESKVKDHYFRQTILTDKYGNVTFTVTPNQLYNPREYAIQLLRHTGRYWIPPKQVVWANIVQELIDNANEEIEREDSTPVDFIRTGVVDDITSMKGREYSSKDEFARGRPIIDSGELIVRSKHIQDMLKFEGQRMQPRQVTDILRAMGFKKGRYGQERLCVWKINYEQFKIGDS
jgi:hypothetical protein